MIIITKDEMEYLTKKRNVKFGENGIVRSHSHHSSWWITESRYNMRELEKYRKKRTVYTYTGQGRD